MARHHHLKLLKLVTGEKLLVSFSCLLSTLSNFLKSDSSLLLNSMPRIAISSIIALLWIFLRILKNRTQLKSKDVQSTPSLCSSAFDLLWGVSWEETKECNILFLQYSICCILRHWNDCFKVLTFVVVKSFSFLYMSTDVSK